MSLSIGAATTVALKSAPLTGACFAVALNSPKAVEPDPLYILVLLDGPRLRPALIQQIYWMRLDGLNISVISRATGCSRVTVQALVDYWQYQAAHAGIGEFVPLAQCPRRAAARNRKIRRPAKKKATLSVQSMD